MNKNFTLQKKMKGVSTLLGRGLLLALLLACSCLASAQTPRVRDEGTHWTPTYGYNGWCTITAQVSIDGVAQTSEDLEVGAFIDNECRASWKLEEYDTDVYVVYLSVNGQYPDDNGKTIAFQLYDHAQNMVLPLTCTSTYQWADNASWGDMEPVAIEFSNNGGNILFADDNVKALCVANWDTNGDGELSYDEAAAVTSLGEVFNSNSTITSFNELQYFNSLTSIWHYAFSNCTGLTSIEIPNSVTSLGGYAFYGCTGLTSVEIPNSVTSIGNEAFRECTGLTSVEIPNSVTSIENGVFRGCSGLTSIEIPNSVTSIGILAFSYCTSLEQIVVGAGNTVYDSRNNCNAIIETATNTLVAGCKNTVIPNSVTSIGDYAFYYCSGLTSIEIPNSVTSIGGAAFFYCTGLTSITVHSEVPPTLGENVFGGVNTGFPVYVPCGSMEAYQNAEGWSAFTNYQCFDNNHEYVDLGLPSGTLWATCNVGANTPEGYGDYFAWGETQPKDYYDWSTYQYCMGSENTLTKYCNNPDFGYNGYTDDLTTLLPEDDAATANWGSDWRMPTKEELEELYNNTTHTWTTQNGVSGRLFTAANGASLFLPAAGFRWDGELYYAGSSGYYWSRSLYTDDPNYAWGLYFDSGGCGMYYYYRYNGFSVRPVRENNALASVAATCNPAEGGAVSGGGAYAAGADCTLTATASAGYTFINWTENGEVVSTENPYTFTVTGDRELVANFEATGGDLPTHGLIAYYPFNGNPNDESGNENHGSLQGNHPQLTTDRFGNENSAYLFGGVYNKGWIKVPNSNSLALDNALTLSFWVNFTDYTGMNGWGSYTPNFNAHAVICKAGDNVGYPGFNAAMGTDGDSLHIYSFNRNPDFYNVDTYYHGYAPGYWLHCVVTVDDTLSRLYVNGELVKESIGATADFSNANSRDMTIGVMNNGSWYPFNGKIDDVAIYNRALTAEEVEMLHGDMECEVVVEAAEGGTATGGSTFNHGETCTVTATANEGYLFTYWTVDGNIVSYEAEYSFPVLASRTYMAHFSMPQTITATANLEEGGTIEGTGEYGQGTQCTLTATPNEGYVFINWMENGQVVSTENPYTFTVAGDRSLVANFLEGCSLTIEMNDSWGDGWNGNKLTVSDDLGGYHEVTLDGGSSGSTTLPIPDGSHVTLGWITGSYINECSFNIRYSNGNLIYHGENMNGSFYYEFDMDCEEMPATTFEVTATAEPAEGGTVEGAGIYNYGETCTLTATPAAGATFANWTEYGNIVSTEATYSFTVLGDRDLVANFTEVIVFEDLIAYYPFDGDPNDYSGNEYHATPYNSFYYETGITGASIAVQGSGYTGSNGGHVMLPELDFGEATGFTLTLWVKALGLTHNDGEAYINFGSDNESDRLYIMHHPDQIRFTYHEAEITMPLESNYIGNWMMYTLTCDEEGTLKAYANGNLVGEQSVTFNGINTSLAALGRHWWSGTTYTRLNASLDEVRIYSRALTEEEIQTLHGDMQFEVTATATEGGTVTGGGTYSHGATCTLTATANDGYSFMYWTEDGNILSYEAEIAFTVLGDRNLVANFMEGNGCVLTIDLYDSYGDGWNGNKLTMSYEGGYEEITLNSGSSGSQILFVPDSAHVTLGWIMGSWTYECSFNVRYANGNVICHGESMSSNFSFEFDMDCVEMPATIYSITAMANPEEGGAVTGYGGYTYGQTCTLTATANEGYTFMYWTENGNQVWTNPVYTFTVTGERNLEAHFALPFTITATAEPAEGGTVEGAGIYNYGETCTLTATANEGYTFMYWAENGNQVSNNPVYSFTVTGERDLVAHFALPFTITATVEPAEGGTVEGAGIYNYGETCTLTATANEGYTFMYWAENGTEVSTDTIYSFTVMGDRDLVANFRGSNLNFEEDLVAYYPFDGDVNDYSGNGNHGTIIGNVVPATDRHGNTNGAYRFPGSAFNYISVPDAECLHLNNFTLSAWVYMDDENFVNCGHELVNKGRDINNGSYKLMLRGIGAQNEYSGNNGAYVDDFPSMNQWHMITGTIEGDQARYYLDGVLMAEATLSHPFSYGNSDPLTLGCHYYNGVPSHWAYTFLGVMDEVRIYSRVLTPDEVMNLYNYSEGSLSGLFSVSETTRVNFSQGNLQYKASTNTWRFAENQWDYAGAGNDNISETYDGWIDLFGWGTSGYNHGANAYQPWSTSQSNYDYWAYGDSGASLSDSTGQADWGYNAISNGGNYENMGWRTMTIEEWTYLLETRNTASGIRYAKAQVNGYDGMVVLPDNWNASIYDLNNVNYSGASFGSNVISAEDWMNILEPAGTVFLPKARLRVGTSTSEYITRGDYWSSSHNNNSFAFGLCFENNGYNLLGAHNRYDGKSVRLVKDANSTVCQINAIPEPEEGGTLMGMGIYMRGDTCTLTATANTGYTFMYWTENGEVVSTEATYSFTVYRDRSLVAHFTLPFAITATAEPVEGGIISGAGVYNYGQTCTLTATANEDYTFMYWTENGVEFSTEPTISFTADSDRSFVAYFTLPFAITATAEPAEGGTVSGAGEYDYNSTCTLTATANEDYYFVRWTKDGEVVSSFASLSFVVTEAASYVAHFALKPVGMVTAMYDPDPDDNQSPYVRVCWDTNPNTNIFEDFETGDFSKFGWETNGWGITDNYPYEGSFCMKSNNHGNYSSQYIQVTVQIPGDRQMSFWSRISSEGGYDFGRFYIDGQEMGSWSGNGGWEQHVYDVAAGEHTFKWAYSKDVSLSYNDDCFYVDDISFFTVARGGNRAVDHYEVYRSEHPENGSWERIADNVTDTCYVDSDWSALAEGWYKYGVVACYVGNDGTTVNESYMVRSNQILRAYPHTITATADPAEGGTITGAGDYVLYTECTLTATPNEGYTFINWTENGEEVTTEPTFSFTVTTERNLVAHFTLPLAITATAEPAEGGTVEGAGEYDYNTTCTLTATANEGYIFMNWTENGTVVSTNPTLSFTVTTERNLVANFFQLLETLSDDFNDGVIDPALWTYGGSSVYESDGLMKIEQNVTDDWVSLITRPMVPSSSGQIVMERSFKIHRSNDYYSGGFAIYLNNVFDNTSSTDVAPVIRVQYFHENWAGKYGTYVGATIDGQDTDTWLCDAVFDTWLTEKVILDMETGTLMYCLNNELVATAEIAGLSSLDVSYFTIRFWPFSWWTGHYHYMDYININTDLGTTFNVTATAEPAEGGTVTGGGTYQLGDTCTISATPAEGYHFVNWTDNGNIVTTDVEYSFTVVADRDLVAHFELNSYDITVSAVPFVSGTVTGAGTYNHFETCTLTATPNAGCTFVNWTKDGVEVSTEATYSFTVTDGGSYEAHFVLTQTYNLAEGYIWWSTSIEQNGINGLGMLQDSLYGNALSIKSQSQFVNYNATTGTWNGSLNSISNESGYIIHTVAPCAVTLTGQAAVPSEHAISMNTGWTWIGYLPSVAMDINTALAGLAASEGDMLKSQHGFASYYPGYGWYGSLNTIQPGWGLMYKSNNSETVTFAYPDSNRGGTLRANLTPENNHWKPDIHAYPDNMSVMAVVELDGEEIMADGYELAAFDANGECRGSVRIVYAEPLNRYMAFLTLSGMDAAELYFGLYDAASSREYLDSDERLVFVTNAKVGDAHEPYVVRFGELTGTSESAFTAQVFPNPVARGERFSIDLGGSTTQPVRVEIVDALGEVTRSLTSVQHPVSIVAPAVSGVYLLRITVEGKGTVVRKLIVR